MNGLRSTQSLITNNLCCRSQYVVMRDGIRLAVDVWLPNEGKQMRIRQPAVLITTRYWRAMGFKIDKPELQIFYPLAVFLADRGYVLVVGDARGSGASFGVRSAEIFPEEIEDLGEVIDWLSQQQWCDGRVATTGTSYSANTTIHSLVTHTSALKCGVCRAPDFDLYRHLMAPGGIPNVWWFETWGDVTAAQDRNDVAALFTGGHFSTMENEADNLLGVKPVDSDTDGSLLKNAIAEHSGNFNVRTLISRMRFIDDGDNQLVGIDGGIYFYDPHLYRKQIEKSNVPIVIRCGWHDAGTQLGALTMFTSFNCPVRVIIGPWSHSGYFLADPFQSGDGEDPVEIPREQVYEMTANSLDAMLKPTLRLAELRAEKTQTDQRSDDAKRRVVEYYTLGEDQWKTCEQWPLPQTQIRRLFLSANHVLSKNPPELNQGSDHYRVDPTAGTGMNNRWHTQMGHPIFFPDRQKEDKKLLVYDTPPLESDTEITGHPVVSIYLSSSAADGQFFVYLETVDPDGRVRLLTEGQLRGLHRKVSDETPPYRMFGPYHSLKKKDAQPLVPGCVTEIVFDLFPISVLLQKGQRIRLAIAGADKDVFAPIAGCESPDIIVERNRVYASYIDLPTVEKVEYCH